MKKRSDSLNIEKRFLIVSIDVLHEDINSKKYHGIQTCNE